MSYMGFVCFLEWAWEEGGVSFSMGVWEGVFFQFFWSKYDDVQFIHVLVILSTLIPKKWVLGDVDQKYRSYVGIDFGFGLGRFRVLGGQDGFWVKNEKWFKWV